MKKEKSIVWGKSSLILSALLLSQVYLSPAFARGDGTILSTDSDCTVCHNNGLVDVMILGPTEVLAHESNTYTLRITGGGGAASPDVLGGLNVYAADGVLSLINAGTELTQLPTNGITGLAEVTHSVEKAFSANTVSWDFIWTAPAIAGAYDIFGQGVNADGNQSTLGDWAGGPTSLNVNVSVIPIPAAGVLFGSALGLLGWLRRRKIA